jgi:hypothetical protein
MDRCYDFKNTLAANFWPIKTLVFKKGQFYRRKSQNIDPQVPNLPASPFQDNLLKELDPSIVEFLRKKRVQAQRDQTPPEAMAVEVDPDVPSAVDPAKVKTWKARRLERLFRHARNSPP